MNDLLSPPPNFLQLMQQANQPVLDRIGQLERHLEDLERRLDDKYYSKETLENRLAPLERAVFGSYQRIWMTVGGIGGGIAVLLTILQHVRLQ